MTPLLAQRLQQAFTLQGQGRFDEAAAICEEVRKVAPREPGPHYISGVIHHRKGALDDAAAAFRKALKLNPRDPGSISGLGMIALQRGRLDEAARQFNLALKLVPGDPGMMNNLALCYRNLGRLADAVDTWRQALKKAPNNIEAMLNLAVSYDALGDMQQADPLFERLKTLALTDPDVASGISKYYLRLGRTSEAGEILRAAMATNPHNAILTEGLMSLEMAEGHTGEAVDLARKTLELAPNRPGALLQLLQSGHDREALMADPVIVRSVDAVRKLCEAGQDAPITLLTAGRVMEQVGEYELAARSYKKGNDTISKALRAAGQSYDRARMDDYVAAVATRRDELARIVAQRLEDGGDTSRPDAKTPIFIVGMPRTGSTLLEQILDGYPTVTIGGEMDGLQTVAAGLGSPHFSAPDAAWIDRFVEDSFDFGAQEKSYRESVARLIDPSDLASARWFVDKNLFNFLYLPIALALFPTARIIYMTRALPDVALSIYSISFLRPLRFDCDLADIGHYNSACERLVDLFAPMLGDRLHRISYDRLVSDPEEETRAVLAGLGLAWDPACLDFFKRSKKAATASMAQVRRPMNRSGLGKSRHYDGLLPLPGLSDDGRE
ncbi:tetratricopeptide repeat protein [Rhodospirillaceae bacterium KN72]|uniref:Tetratricopeptide repeat protein n=1 Tax=Pacificispira spongiicola TaxID=2729598 RepID=A0A7Y0E0S1_9PROT|nr:tetratricopeptide repeat-containing sulfotransferase family protein [Pacificispira spongiicola]NMM45018.1 tetratricopeptide repeat protein [Pacificispira spongiicola]